MGIAGSALPLWWSCVIGIGIGIGTDSAACGDFAPMSRTFWRVG